MDVVVIRKQLCTERGSRSNPTIPFSLSLFLPLSYSPTHPNIPHVVHQLSTDFVRLYPFASARTEVLEAAAAAIAATEAAAEANADAGGDSAAVATVATVPATVPTTSTQE